MAYKTYPFINVDDLPTATSGIYWSGILSTQKTISQSTDLKAGVYYGVGSSGVNFNLRGYTMSLSTTPTKMFVTTGDDRSSPEISNKFPDSQLAVARTMPSSQSWYGMAYGNGIYLATVAGAAASQVAAWSTDAITWTATTMPSSQLWIPLVYNPVSKIFISAGYNSTTSAYTTDGITWTTVALPSNTAWYEAAYGDGKVVITSTVNTSFVYTTDGISWTSGTIPTNTNGTGGIDYGEGLWVTVRDGLSNAGATSTDLITWTATVLPSSENWKSVTYGNGIFISFTGDNATSVTTAASSTDGITWSLRTMPSALNWWDSTFGNGIFFAHNVTANTSAATSTNGITWTLRALPVAVAHRISTYGNGKIVIGCSGPSSNVSVLEAESIALPKTFAIYEGTGINNYLYDSEDQTHESSPPILGDETIFAETLINDRVYNENNVIQKERLVEAVGFSSENGNININNRTYSLTSNIPSYINHSTSENSQWIEYSTQYIPNTFQVYNAAYSVGNIVTYGNGIFVNVASGSSTLYYSTNLTSWSSTTLPKSSGWQNLAAYGNGRFVIKSNTADTVVSTDAITWTLSTSNGFGYAVFARDVFVGVSGGLVETSTDGISWTLRTTATIVSPQWAAYGNGCLVLVPSSGSTSSHSTDANFSIFSSATLPASGVWPSVAYGNGTWVAMYGQSAGTTAASSSTTPPTWTLRTMPTSATWQTVTFANGYFVAGSLSSAAAYSTNGITWTSFLMPAISGQAQLATNLIYGNGQWFTPTSGQNSGYYLKAPTTFVPHTFGVYTKPTV